MKVPPARSRPFSNILCPIDFSNPSRSALRIASELADDPAIRITVLYVHDPTIAGVEAIAFPDRSLAELRGEIERFAAKVMSPERAAAPTTVYTTVIGNPSQEILKFAKRCRCDLIVMGSRGLGGISKLLLGSTTDRVVHHAHVPVLAVRSGTPVKRRARKRGTAGTIRLAG